MYSAYEILLLKRFILSKKTDGYISVFSFFSIIGITIGVSAIIIVMSVMNGFREELTARMLGINGHINIYSYTNEINKDSFNFLQSKEDSIVFFPSIETQALIISNENSKGVYIRSYKVQDFKKKYLLDKSIISGKLYKEQSNEVLIGYALANKLDIKLGDSIKIAIPKSDKTIFGNIPRFKTLKVSGIFNLGMYEYDSNFIFTDQHIVRKLLLLENNSFNKIEIITKKPNDIDELENKINEKINLSDDDNLYSISWKESNKSLINALKVEKNVMFLILTLIILVASLNIVSGLIIFVREKNKDIGILKTIGMSDGSLIKVFVSIGFIMGLIGTLLGSLIGIIFSFNITSIQNFIERIFDINLFSEEVYYLSNLPSKLNFYEVISVVCISLFISLLATLFPAYRCSKINPILTIKND